MSKIILGLLLVGLYLYGSVLFLGLLPSGLGALLAFILAWVLVELCPFLVTL